MKKKTIQALIKNGKKKGSVYLIEDATAPFPNSFLQKMDSLNYINNITNIDDVVSLYKISKKTN